ncbi:MAG: lysophospholipase [Treponema sp.]|nr:lysophospholipase [Treponema sp.]
MQHKNFTFKTRDGFELWMNRWEPDDPSEIKGLVQLHHGLAEHALRYDRFGSILAENGYVLNAYDMRGHGQTAENSIKNGTGIFGKLADKKGFDTVVEDLNEVIEALKKDFPNKKVILFGHSFGSFVSQSYIENYSDRIDSCVLSGTAGPRKFMIGAGSFFVNLCSLFMNKNKPAPFFDKIAFGSYNDRVENPKTKNDWLSANMSNVLMYEQDKWCGFTLTASFFKDMMYGLKKIHKSKNIKKIRKELPVLFIYGEEDPVGDYGKSINKLFKIYQSNGMTNVQLKSYPGDRHELLNEDDKEKVENDVLEWISSL